MFVTTEETQVIERRRETLNALQKSVMKLRGVSTEAEANNVSQRLQSYCQRIDLVH